MTRVNHDHPAIETVDGTVTTGGPLSRPVIELPDDEVDRFPIDEVIAIIVDDSRVYTTVLDDRTFGIAGLYETPRAARSGTDGVERLQDWLARRDLTSGRTVHVDVITPGDRYGLRGPGETARYSDPKPADESLQSIAREYFEPDS